MTAQPSTQSPSNLGKGLAIAAMVVVIIASLLPVPFYPYLGILGGALLASIGMVLQRDAELFGIITGIVALVGATFLSPVTFHFVKQEGALLVLIVLLIAASPLITLGLLKLKGK